jgi:hypothetical protein
MRKSENKILRRTFRSKKVLLIGKFRELHSRRLNELKRGANGGFHNASWRNNLYGCGIEGFCARISQYSNTTTQFVFRSGK